MEVTLMAYNETVQMRKRLKCSQCDNERLVTVWEHSESACISALNHERREGLCQPCERKSPDENALSDGPKRLRFAKCPKGMCGKVMPFGALQQHIAQHNLDKKVFNHRRVGTIQLPY